MSIVMIKGLHGPHCSFLLRKLPLVILWDVLCVIIAAELIEGWERTSVLFEAQILMNVSHFYIWKKELAIGMSIGYSVFNSDFHFHSTCYRERKGG